MRIIFSTKVNTKIIYLLKFEKRKLIKMEESPKNNRNEKLKSWFKKVGILGVIFFTLKGLLWLVVIYFGADFLNGCGK